MLKLFYREGCHLCEDMVSMLHRGWPDRLNHLEWCDVDQNPQWKDEYGLRVPVLMLDQTLICELTPSPDALISHFGDPQNPL
jgi:hypothetical protein